MEQIFIHASNGELWQPSPELWQQNQQQQSLLLRYLALPLQENEQCLWLGVDSLNNLAAIETFAFLTGKQIEPVLLSNANLKTALQALNPEVNNQAGNRVAELLPLDYAEFVPENEQNNAHNKDEPIIQLLNQIFEQALHQKASDIHFEPQTDCLRVRFRIDGVLQTQAPIAKNLANRLISRLKLLAKLDISETRLPQDGRFQFKTTFADLLDFRLSTLATALGEKAVLRLQGNKPVQLSFVELGMTSQQQQQFQQALSQPQGLILVTGPTGSGKSISLYTALQWLNSPEKHILTAEDPIEIELAGIMQSQVNPQIGLDFSRLLRCFLRQDPDIIMLGEIRDEESAAMALRAAQTGHLVLSTLHTNDAFSAISRLRQLGIAEHEIESSLLLVVAQRLLRKICPHCLGAGSNCHCYQGYAGRVGVYQFLWTESQQSAPQAIQYKQDFASLRESALQKVQAQVTDLKEVQRVLGAEYVC